MQSELKESPDGSPRIRVEPGNEFRSTAHRWLGCCVQLRESYYIVSILVEAQYGVVWWLHGHGVLSYSSCLPASALVSLSMLVCVA